MKQIITIALLVIGYSISAQSIDYNLSKKGYVAEGYDVVAYFSQSAKKGSKKYNTEHDGVQYLFHLKKTWILSMKPLKSLCLNTAVIAHMPLE